LDFTTVAPVSYKKELINEVTQPADGDNVSAYDVVDDTIDGFGMEWSCSVTLADAIAAISSTGSSINYVNCYRFQVAFADQTTSNYRFTKNSPKDGIATLWRVKDGVITGF
jgi:hypothetical protein